MKTILITGANSYVGTSLERYLKQWPEDYRVDTVDMIGDGWKEQSFRGYDAVFHVAGIVHMERSKKDPAKKELYDRVNHLLAVETGAKAKAEGVKQFIFMSSASVYGKTVPVGREFVITPDTPLRPEDNYGISKAKAEEGLKELADTDFKVVILRPPTVYGKGCRGNYSTLSKMAKKLPVFPWVENRRSMLYIDNLSELVRLVVEDGAEGIFCPQNEEYSNTSDLVRRIAAAAGKKVLLIKGFIWALKILSCFTDLVDKAFGSLCYAPETGRYPKNYCVKTLSESILETEN